MHETVPFSIPVFRNFVPEKLRPWIIILIVVVFQLSGGVYLAAVSEMAGSLALMQEDIMMAGYASMAGMALTFTVMFRLKFCFTSKVSLLACCAALILCNLICMHTASIPLLVITCFIAGIFRMWGTFECNSTIQLWLTPKRDLSVFFCYIYLLVHSSIQLSGLTTVYTTFFAKWEYMHWLVAGLLAAAMLATMILFSNRRIMRKLPLFGIDWMGGLLWGATVLCIIFVCVYGEHYEWYESPWIKAATATAAVSLLLNLWRASFIRHPFISLATWRFPIIWLTLGLYLVSDLLTAPSHLLEHIYMESVLGYDSLNVASLNWVVIAGVAAGALFTYRTFSLRRWSYRNMTIIAFAAITGYLMVLYFTIDCNLSKESLIIPLFLRSFGSVIVAICFLTSLSRIPFQYFFQAISIQAFVSAGIGGALGTALIGHALKAAVKKNMMLLGAGTDHLNPLAARLLPEQLTGAVAQQALMVSMKELYGWLAIVGLLCLLLFLAGKSDLRPIQALHPTYKALRQLIRRELAEQPE